MTSPSQAIFESLNAPVSEPSGRPRFSVAPLPGRSDSFVGKDPEGKACVLVKVPGTARVPRAPILFESLEVLFDVPVLISTRGKDEQDTVIIVRCRVLEREITSYFLSVCDSILRLLPPSPEQAAIANAINRLAFIFRKLQQPPVRSLNGLFGELLLIRQSRNPTFALSAWRIQQTSRFDFSASDVRLDVKTAAGRVRAHTFSFDQCNPPSGTLAVAASLFVERASGGISLQELVTEIEHLCASSLEPVVRLHDVISETLGSSLPEALTARFDRRLAESSLQFYDVQDIPAIRGEPPPGVTDIHFRSDLSMVRPSVVEDLAQRNPTILEFLPST
jgi:hypothetical protein